jgi:hypothetical protein
MVTTAAAVTSTVKTVEYHVKYNYHYNPLEADYCLGRDNGKPKNGYHHSNKYYL